MISNDYNLDEKKYTNVLLKQLFLWYMSFFDFWYVCVVSVALRLPAAYRSWTGSGRGGGRLEGLEGAEDVEGMSLGGKL